MKAKQIIAGQERQLLIQFNEFVQSPSSTNMHSYINASKPLEEKEVKELLKSFNGRGEVKNRDFTQIRCTIHAYLYEVRAYGRIYYEVFERRIHSRFGNVTYPKSNAFGAWAWTTEDFDKALQIFTEINKTSESKCV